MRRSRWGGIGHAVVPGLASVLLAAAACGADEAPSRPACVDDTRSGRAILDCLAFAENSLRRWDDRHQHLTLTGFSADRREVTRELDLYEKRLSRGRRGMLAVFRSPADIAGAAFLVLAESAGATLQWVYTPARRRPRMVAPDVLRRPVEGTDLVYEDFRLVTEVVDWTDADVRAARDADDAVDGVACHVITLLPLRNGASYPKIRIWIGRDDAFARRFELYEREDRVARRITHAEVAPVGRVLLARRVVIETPPAGSWTEIRVTEADVDRGVAADRFEPQALDRGPL